MKAALLIVAWPVLIPVLCAVAVYTAVVGFLVVMPQFLAEGLGWDNTAEALDRLASRLIPWMS